jgi:hypothetical protein
VSASRVEVTEAALDRAIAAATASGERLAGGLDRAAALDHLMSSHL